MQEEYFLLLLLLLVLYLIYSNSNVYEYMTADTYTFTPEGYGERGQYYYNIDVAPVYRTIKIPTIFD
jgi:hypothetical protein